MWRRHKAPFSVLSSCLGQSPLSARSKFESVEPGFGFTNTLVRSSSKCPTPAAKNSFSSPLRGFATIFSMENAVRIALVSGSLNPESLSRQMAQHAEKALRALGADVDFIDLQEINLPMCDGDSAYSDPEVERTRSRIESAKGILIAAPVYNFYLNAAVKNLIELTGSAWEDKAVGFLNAAGGYSSYMSVMSIANSLMLDFRCVVVPRFVYAVGSAFPQWRSFRRQSRRTYRRIGKRTGALCQPTRALKHLGKTQRAARPRSRLAASNAATSSKPSRRADWEKFA